MPAIEPDTRSREGHVLDENFAQTAPLPPLNLPPDAASVEVNSARNHALIAVSGIVENGVVRPLDPSVGLREGARVIIVAAEDASNATIPDTDRHDRSRERIGNYWRVCGYLSVAWIALGILAMAAGVYAGPEMAEPIAPPTLKMALWLMESGILLPVAAIMTVPGAVAFMRRSRRRSFRLWFGCYSLLIIALISMNWVLCEFIEQAGMIRYPDGSFRRYHFPFDERFGIGLVIAIPWFLFVMGQLGESAIQLAKCFRQRAPLSVREFA